MKIARKTRKARDDMTNEKQTISNLKKLKSFHNGSYGADIDRAIKALEQQPILDKIRAEIEQTADEEQKYDEKWAKGLRYAVKIIDKYRQEGI